MIHCSSFRIVPCDKLIRGQKYKIQLPNATYKGTYEYQTFDGYYRCIHLTDITENKSIHKMYGSMYFSKAMFYNFVSQKTRIQNAMERRALNKIIGKIIGDPYFRW
jgi:hypothetical protein